MKNIQIFFIISIISVILVFNSGYVTFIFSNPESVFLINSFIFINSLLIKSNLSREFDNSIASFISFLIKLIIYIQLIHKKKKNFIIKSKSFKKNYII